MASFNQSEYTAIPREAQLKFLRDAWTVPTSSRAPGTARAPSKPPTSASGAASGRSSAECASIKVSGQVFEALCSSDRPILPLFCCSPEEPQRHPQAQGKALQRGRAVVGSGSGGA